MIWSVETGRGRCRCRRRGARRARASRRRAASRRGGNGACADRREGRREDRARRRPVRKGFRRARRRARPAHALAPSPAFLHNIGRRSGRNTGEPQIQCSRTPRRPSSPLRMSAPIYLDYNATTPVAEDVLDAMLPFFREHFGNPSSDHALGWAADEAVRQARERTARVVGATPRTILFTSGATESISLALHGLGEVYGGRRHHIVTVATEHKAVLETCAALEREGFEVTTLGDRPRGPPRPRRAARRRCRTRRSPSRPCGPTTRPACCTRCAPSPTSPTRPARSSCRTPRRPSARCPWTSRRRAWTCSPSRRTSSTAPRASARSTSAAAGPTCASRRSTTAAMQEDGLRAGTLNVPGIVGHGRRRRRSRGAASRPRPPARRRSATASRRPSRLPSRRRASSRRTRTACRTRRTCSSRASARATCCRPSTASPPRPAPPARRRRSSPATS